MRSGHHAHVWSGWAFIALSLYRYNHAGLHICSPVWVPQVQGSCAVGSAGTRSLGSVSRPSVTATGVSASPHRPALYLLLCRPPWLCSSPPPTWRAQHELGCAAPPPLAAVQKAAPQPLAAVQKAEVLHRHCTLRLDVLHLLLDKTDLATPWCVRCLT